jgi:hypothetical protein
MNGLDAIAHHNPWCHPDFARRSSKKTKAGRFIISAIRQFNAGYVGQARYYDI